MKPVEYQNILAVDHLENRFKKFHQQVRNF